MHWCDLCKCWMNDSTKARLNHERGSKHQENLAKSALPCACLPRVSLFCFRQQQWPVRAEVVGW